MARTITLTHVSAETVRLDRLQTNMANSASERVEALALGPERALLTVGSSSQEPQEQQQQEPSTLTSSIQSELVDMERFKQRHRQQAAQFNDWYALSLLSPNYLLIRAGLPSGRRV